MQGFDAVRAAHDTAHDANATLLRDDDRVTHNTNMPILLITDDSLMAVCTKGFMYCVNLANGELYMYFGACTVTLRPSTPSAASSATHMP